MNSNTFDRLSFLSLFLVIVLLPIFFLPFTNVPVEISKGLLLVVGLTAAVIFWSLARFFDGKIVLPKSPLLLAACGVVLSFLLSALFTNAQQVSFFGTMFDIGTFWFIFAGFILMLLCSIFFKNIKNSKIVLFGVIISSAIVMVFQTVHIFFPTISSFGILTDKTSNVIGSWNAFGLFSGLSVVVSLFVIEFFSVSKLNKLLLQIFAFLGVFLIATVNFPLAWTLVGLSSLIIFVYKASIVSAFKDEEDKSGFPVFSFIIVMITLLFFVSHQYIGNFLPSHLGIQQTEVSPLMSATMDVTKSVLKESPVFGVGPNKFGNAWAMYKPVGINGTLFWDVYFDSGSGLLPTFASTTGILGVIAWVLFFILFMMNGIKSIFSSSKNGVNWEAAAFFVLAVYLFIALLFYSTGAVIFLLALAFTGIFIGLSASNNQKEISISFLNDHRKSFFSILVLVAMVIFSASLLFKYVERFASMTYFRKALASTTTPLAEENINKALQLYSNDLYLRTYSDIYAYEFDSIFGKSSSGSALSDQDKALLQASLDKAVNGAQLATVYDSKQYLNWQNLGSLYQHLGKLGVKDAYSKSLEAYKVAETLNPNNPGIKLSIASVLISLGQTKEAKDYVNTSLVLKPDFIDAFIVLSQIAKSEGDTARALLNAQKALSVTSPDSSSYQDISKYVDALKNGSSNSYTPTTNTLPTKPKK